MFVTWICELFQWQKLTKTNIYKQDIGFNSKLENKEIRPIGKRLESLSVKTMIKKKEIKKRRVFKRKVFFLFHYNTFLNKYIYLLVKGYIDSLISKVKNY